MVCVCVCVCVWMMGCVVPEVVLPNFPGKGHICMLNIWIGWRMWSFTRPSILAEAANKWMSYVRYERVY